MLWNFGTLAAYNHVKQGTRSAQQCADKHFRNTADADWQHIISIRDITDVI